MVIIGSSAMSSCPLTYEKFWRDYKVQNLNYAQVLKTVLPLEENDGHEKDLNS